MCHQQSSSPSFDRSIRKSFPNGFLYLSFFFRPQASAIDPAPYRIEEFQPVLQRRVGDLLPLVVALFARIEYPRAPDVLSVNLEVCSFFGYPFPTNFCFGHSGSGIWQIDTGHRHRGDAFLATNEPQVFVGRGFNSNSLLVDLQSLGNVELHFVQVRINLWGLRDHG